MARSVDRWLGRLAESTAKVEGRIFRAWLEWMGVHGGQFSEMGPDDLIEWQRGHLSGYDLLDVVQDYVTQKRGTKGYKGRVFSSIKGFFSHNRAALPADPSFIVRGDKPAVVGRLSLVEFKEILASCNLTYRAVFLCMFQGGMGAGELVYWSDNGLESVRRQMQQGARYLRVDLPGRKKAKNVRPYYTFIGRDGIDVLRAWLKARPDVDHDAIFVTQFKTPMKYDTLYMYWLLRLRQLGLISKPKGYEAMSSDERRGIRYGKSDHELRDLFRTRWEKSGSSGTAAEYFMGHIIDRLDYNKAFRDVDYARRQYQKAESWLNVVSEEPDKVPRDEVLKTNKKIEELEELVQHQGRVLAAIQRAQKLGLI